MQSSTDQVIGFDQAGYESRPGYSPEPIREALWRWVSPDLSGTALDAGAGNGEWTGRLLQSGRFERIIGVDLAEHAPRAGIEFHTRNLATDALPCDADSLDWVFAVEVIEHLANPRNFVSESYRCLKPGGRLALTTPCNECLTAKLSFMFRGYFPEFCDHAYLTTGHITPVTELDLRRMAAEAGFAKIEFAYPLPGRMPKLSFQWQQFFPFLHGRWWSDTLIAILTK
jgi:SAM-dependent methyltransferase